MRRHKQQHDGGGGVHFKQPPLTQCSAVGTCVNVKSGKRKGQCTAPNPWTVYQKVYHSRDGERWKRLKRIHLPTKPQLKKWACERLIATGHAFVPFYDQLPSPDSRVCTSFEPHFISNIVRDTYRVDSGTLKRTLSACKKHIKFAGFDEHFPIKWSVRQDIRTDTLLTLRVDEPSLAVDVILNKLKCPRFDRSFAASDMFVTRPTPDTNHLTKKSMTEQIVCTSVIILAYLMGKMVLVRRPNVTITKTDLVHGCVCYFGMALTPKHFRIEIVDDSRPLR